MDDQQIATYLAALAVERQTWEAVGDCLPGSGTFDPVKWEAWRRAVRASDEARRALPMPSPFSSCPASGRKGGPTPPSPYPFQ